MEQTFPADMLDRLREAGFECATIGRNPERIRVLKHNCAALLERQTDGRLRLAQPPGYLFRGEIARLWDAGYQKFWLLGPPSDEPFDEPRRPVLAAQLKELHRYTEELALALGVPSFYNECIGTTSEVSVYDRLQDRSPARWKP